MSMSSILKDIAESPVILAKEIAKVFTVVSKAESVVNAVVADEGNIKIVLGAVVSGALTVGADIATAVSVKGLSWTDDTNTVNAVEAYFKNIIEGELIPCVEKIYSDISIAVKTPVPSAAAIAAGMAPSNSTPIS